MLSYSVVQRMVMQAPKLFLTREINLSSVDLLSQIYQSPNHHKLFESKTESNKYLLNWFNDGWNKMKKQFSESENSESVKQTSSTKSRTLVDDTKKSASSKAGEISKLVKNKSINDWNTVRDVAAKNKNELVDDVEKITKSTKATVNEVAKVKNKAQKALTENWNAIKEANSKNSKEFVDNVKESARTSVDEVSKSLKNKANRVSDEKTEDIKNRIRKRGEKLKRRISKDLAKDNSRK